MSQIKVNAVTDASGGNTATINSMTPTADSLQGFRNRIINGDMRIDQRNAGAAVTANGAYPVDRFLINNDTTGAYSGQQDSSAPAGFVNSLKFTTTTADASIAAGELCFVRQFVEGTNVSDLAWGTANAKSVMLSFWVRSSLTGSFSGAISNSGYNRSYPFTYSISAANTWEYKTVTIPGDTTGTWLTTTGIGLRIYWNLGTGTDNTGTASSWVGAGNVGADSTVAVIGTLNATWYITGAQLEVGSVATPFERRDYGRELAMCQRYYQIFKGNGSYLARFSAGQAWVSTNTANHNVSFIVSMRAAPVLTQSGLQLYSPNLGAKSATIALGADTNENGAQIDTSASTGLTGGNMWYIAGTNTSSYAAFSAEL
jgi:hypothetical protein